MILTCPNCSGQFNIDDKLIGENGRKVKCSSCSEIWFQKLELSDVEEEVEETPLTEDALNSIEEAEDEDDFMFEVDLVEDDAVDEGEEDQLDSVSDEDEHDDMISLESIKRAVELHDSKFNNDSKSKPLGYGVAALFFVFTLILLLINSSYFLSKYPSTNAFYTMFGINLEIPGKGLVFDGLVAEDNGETITVSGRIINLESETVNVPVIEASLNNGAGDSLSQWYIQPPQDNIDGEGDISFHSVYYKPDDAGAHSGGDGNNHKNIGEGQVQIRFSLLSKTGATDDGNSSSHHQDAQNHQSAHEESSGSHRPSSSEQHQEPSHSDH